MSCHPKIIQIFFPAFQLTDFTVTAPATAARGPIDHYQENSLNNLNFCVSSRNESGSAAAGTELRDFQGSTVKGAQQRKKKKTFKQPNKPKSLKWQAFQRGSNLVRANPAGRLKGVYFGRGRGLDAGYKSCRKDVGEKSELNDKCQGQISEHRDTAGEGAAPLCTVFNHLIGFLWHCTRLCTAYKSW